MKALTLAREMYAHDLAPIPIIEGTKRPACKWRQWQQHGPTPRQLAELFNPPGRTVGVICGAPSQNLFILDCDNRRALDDAIYRLDIPETWIIETPRGGHIYLRSPFPIKTGVAEGMDIKAQGSYVLAPGAMHPSGIRYAWLTKPGRIHTIRNLEELDWLDLEAAPSRPEGMPLRAWNLLTGKANAPHDNSKSAAEYAAVCSLVRHGWSYARIVTLFESHAPPDGHYQTRRTDEYKTEWIQNAYKKACRLVQSTDSPELRIIRQQRTWAIGRAWPGQTGSTDRATYFAHLSIAERSGQLTYGASERELAELAGIHRLTARVASSRLVTQHLVDRNERSAQPAPHRWTLRNVVRLAHSIENPNVLEWTNGTTYSHDAFRWQGLGKAAAQIFELLQGTPEGATLYEIAKATGRHPGTVSRILDRMHRKPLEMVMPGELKGRAVSWMLAPNVDLDEIAHRLETTGLGRIQKDRHAQERAKHQRRLKAGVR
jgi:hypothetical protein